MANNNKRMVDLPFFELLNQAPVATSATAGITTVEDGNSRFIYYLTASTFYRYDTVADTWQQLTSPNVAPVTGMSLRYTRFRGYHGRTISATSTTIKIPGLRGKVLDGKTLKILKGKGYGQERVLTYVGETVHDAGVITGTTTSTLADSTKRWRVNEWCGYLVGITFGTGSTQYKKILYNDTTTLYISDTNLMPHDPWNNQIFVAAAPNALPVTTAGSQAHYQIMSQDYTVPAWDEVPDSTSFFTVETGGIYLLSSAAAAPFLTLQYYDIAHDSWQSKTVPQSLIGAQFTDFTIERTGQLGNVIVANTGTVSSTNRTLSDTGLNLVNDRYANHRIYITGGYGRGQTRRIVAHTNNTFTIARNWEYNPEANSTYEIWPDANRIYLAGGGAAALFKYSIESDCWLQGSHFDDGLVNNIGAYYKNDWEPIGITSGARIAAGVRAINPVPTAGGSNYVVGDVLTHSTGGTGAQIRVKNIDIGGVVTELVLVHTGTATGFTTGTGKTTTGGTGTGCTFEITEVGATALITTVTNHLFEMGEKVTFSGCTEAAWNTEHTIIGVPGITTFCVAVTATANMAANITQSTSTIVDSTKNWIPNEHVGRLVHLMVAGTSPTSQIRWITGNGPTQLNVATITAGTSGTSKYVIYDSKVFGVDDSRKETDKKNSGWATGGNTTQLIDNTKNWIPNQWQNYFFKIEAGDGYAANTQGRIQILSNSSNTLNYAVQTFTPSTNTKYEIADSWGLAATGSTTGLTDTTKNWTTNLWAGKRLRITGGTGVGQEASITSSTGTALTTGTITAPDATSPYAILGIPPRGTGIEMIWNWGCTDANVKGRYMYLPRGGASNTLDIYDITTGKWTYGYFISPQGDTFTTGSSYAYDGVNTIYMARSAASTPIRIFAYDIANNTVSGAFTTTWLQGTAHIGNFMEIALDPTGEYEFVYVLQNTGTLFSRALIF